MSADSQEKEILETLGIQFIKGILNVLLKLILLFSENLHITYFIKLLEKKYFPSVGKLSIFPISNSKFKE